MEILSREHRLIESVLRALEGICLSLERGETVPREPLAEMVDFIRSFADGFHHEKEERHLFPVLENYGVPRAGGPIGVMLYEHETGRQLVAEMQQAAQGYAEGEARAASRFVVAARQYIELLMVHIHKEDNVLFKISENVLDSEALNSLNKDFEEVALGFGADAYAKYEQLARTLEQAWAK
jgi:hemerythrin-like domain-containing protein